MTRDRVLEMHRQMGTEPEEDELPPEMDEFAQEVQEAFTIYGLLQDRVEGMGTYLGKDYSYVKDMLDVYEYEDPKLILFLVRYIDNIRVDIYNKKMQAKSKSKNTG